MDKEIGYVIREERCLKVLGKNKKTPPNISGGVQYELISYF